MQAELARGQVQRVTVARVAGRDVALLDVRIPGETLHIVCAGGLGVGVLDALRRQQLRTMMRGLLSPAQARWRARIEGAHVTHLGARMVELGVEGSSWRALSERDGALSLAEGPAPGAGGDDPPSAEVLEERGARIVEELLRTGTGARAEALKRALTKTIARIDRRMVAVQGDLAQAEGADAMGQRARLFVADGARAPRGATELVAVDWSSGVAEHVHMTLDPARPAQEQIDAVFRRARRLREGAKIAQARLEEARSARDSLARIAAALGAPDADLDVLEGQARAAAPRDFKLAPAGGSGAGPVSVPRPRDVRSPYRTFSAAGGAHILVGRGAADNDALTLHVARPHDLWLHAKGHTGAHVVVRLDKGASCPAEVLVDAAHLAAHFSDARDERLVEVQYAPRRYVRKPKGSAPGQVLVDREKVMVLRREEAVLRRLLSTEAAL
jgi:hypothetical protein